MTKVKRPSVTIDESVIQRMISGETPQSEELSEKSYGETEPTPASEVPVKATTDTSKPRKRKEHKDYRETFLGKRAPASKRQTYISAAIFAKITEIKAVVANDITIPTFLDNVLEHHLDTYKDEINELYECKTNKKPLE